MPSSTMHTQRGQGRKAQAVGDMHYGQGDNSGSITVLSCEDHGFASTCAGANVAACMSAAARPLPAGADILTQQDNALHDTSVWLGMPATVVAVNPTPAH